MNYFVEIEHKTNIVTGGPWSVSSVNLIPSMAPTDPIYTYEVQENTLVSIGQRLVNGVFEDIPPTEESIRAKYAEIMTNIVAPYSAPERETWFLQLDEADKYLADNTAEIEMLDTMAVVRGITVDELIIKIKENDNEFRAAIGAVLGQQQKELDDLAV